MNTQPFLLSPIKTLVAVALVAASLGSAMAAEKTWANTGTTWSNNASWVGNVAPANSLTTDTVLFNNATFTSLPNSGTTSIAGITVGDGATTYGNLTFTNTALTIGASGITVKGNGTTAVGQVSLTNGIVIGANQTWTNNGYNSINVTAALKSGTISTSNSLGAITLTLAGNGTSGSTRTVADNNNYNIDLAGIISEGTGTTLSLVVNTTGAGQVSLNAANTFSGGLTVKSGIVQLSNAASAGNGTITLGDSSGSADAILKRGTNTGTNAITVAAGSSGLLAIGNVGPSNTSPVYSGPITMANNLTVFGDGVSGGGTTLNGTFSGTGNLTLATSGVGVVTFGTASTVNMTGKVINNGGGTGNNQILGAVGTNVTGIVQNSATKLSMNGTISSSGQISVNAGELQLYRQYVGALATNNVSMGGGRLNLENTGATGALNTSLGTLTFSAGESTVKTTRTAAFDQAVTFSSLAARSAGATGTFWNNGGTNSATNGFILTGQTANSFIDKGIFFGTGTSIDYAWYNAASSYVRAINYGVDAGSATNAGGASIASASYQKITGNLTAQNNATFTTLNLNGPNSNVTMAAGQALTVGSILKNGNGAAVSISGGNGIALANNAELVVYTSSATAAATMGDYLTISNAITANGTNALTKSGAGVLSLSGTNTYNGATYVNAGILTFMNTASRTGGSAVTAGWQGSVGLGVGGSGYYSSTNLDNLFANSLSGFTMSATSGVAIDTTAGNFTYGSNISGIRKITKLGSNTLILNGTNTFTGAVAVEQGVLNIQSSSALGTTGGATTVSNGAALELQGNITVAEGLTLYGTGVSNAGVIRNISGNNTISGTINPATIAARINSDSGTLSLTASAITSSTANVTFGGAGNVYVSSNITGASAIVSKDGAGTLTLAGANTYTGNTTVSVGTLLVNNTSGSGTGAGNVNVASGATLGGTGTITPGAGKSLAVSGILAPGASGAIGTLTINGSATSVAVANFASGASFEFHLTAGTGSDKVALVSGAANDFAFSNNNIAFTLSGVLANGQTYTLFSADVAGAYSGLTFDGGGKVTAGLTFTGLGGAFQTSSYISQVGNDLVLNVVPEPSTWALLAFSLTTVMVLRRRRQS